MAYRAFVPLEETHFADAIRWFQAAVDEERAEQALISQRNEQKIRIHLYNMNDGPLVELVGTMDSDWGGMQNSYLLNYRVMGSDSEIEAFLKIYGEHREIREVEVLDHTDPFGADELETKILDGAVFPGEYTPPIIADATDLM